MYKHRKAQNCVWHTWQLQGRNASKENTKKKNSIMSNFRSATAAVIPLVQSRIAHDAIRKVPFEKRAAFSHRAAKKGGGTLNH
jgi:hypothetical protein